MIVQLPVVQIKLQRGKTMFRKRKVISSGRIIHTLEKKDGFYVTNHDGSIVRGRFFGLNDSRFSPPLEDFLNQDKTILSLIEEERQKAYLQGLTHGLRTAIHIKNRHFENHKLLEPNSPEELWKFDEDDIANSWNLPESEVK